LQPLQQQPQYTAQANPADEPPTKKVKVDQYITMDLENIDPMDFLTKLE
jgi:hypothetical protein